MQRIIYLLVFFAASLLVLKPAWGIVTGRPVTEPAHAAVASKSETVDRPSAKSQATPVPLYKPSLRPDGHLKLESDSGYMMTSPFEAGRRGGVGAGAAVGGSSPRLSGLARSSRGVRAVIEQGNTVITLAEGETKSGITLLEVDEAGKTVTIKGAFGERVLSLNDSQP